MEIDQSAVEADNLEQLGALIRPQRGDAHLGQDLEQTLVERAREVPHQRFFGGRRFDLASRSTGRCERAIWAHRIRAESQESGHLMIVSSLGGVHDEARAQAQALSNQSLVGCRNREQRGHARMGRVHAPITQHDAAGAMTTRGDRLKQDAIESALELVRLARHLEKQGNTEGRLIGMIDDRGEISLGEHGAAEFEDRAFGSHLAERTRSRA